MPQLSRRQFLKFAGITLAGSQLPDLAHWEKQSSAYGRALHAAPIYTRPDSTSAVVRHLWPDSVVPLVEAHGKWYRAEDGYIERRMMQPVNLHIPKADPPQLPFWGEVVAPVAPIWQWCAVDALLVTRIGHGGAARIIDQLPGWYAIADEKDTLLGWSQASNWTPVGLPTNDIPLHLKIDGSHMTVYRNSQIVADAPVSLSQPIPPGTYPLEKGQIGGLRCHISPENDYHGSSWQLRFGNHFDLTSIYWHNQFGDHVPGPSVQITPILGRWLYMAANTDSTITIHRQT